MTTAPWQPEAEVAELRRQLEQARAQLESIRRGDFDALVIESDTGHGVLTIPGAEEPNRLLISEMSEGVLTVSAEGTVLYGNDSAAELTGFPRDQLVGASLSDLFAPKSEPVLRELLVDESPLKPSIEAGLIRRDGDLVPVSVAARELDLGARRAVCLMLTDLTEQKRAAAALRFQAGLLDAAGEAIFAADSDRNIIYANGAAEDLFDWPPGELIGRPLADVRAPGTDEIAAAIRRNVAQGLAWRGELMGVRRNGTEFPMGVTVTPILGDGREVSATIAVITDLTEQKRMVGELAANEERFRSLVSKSEDLFAIVDADGVVLAAYGPFEAHLVMDAETVIGSTIFEWLQPEDVARARRVWSELLNSGQSSPQEEYWTLRPDGSSVCLAVIGQDLRDDPAVGGIVCTARDVTHLRRLSQAREAVSAVNAALLRATDEVRFLQDVCDAVVRMPMYAAAWIGLTDQTAPLGVHRVASSGDSPAYVEAIERLAGDTGYEGPASLALSSRQVNICQDVGALSDDTPWRDLALDRGYRSIIALPLVNSEEFGVFSLYAKSAGEFTDDAVAVLQELANDTSFGLAVLRTRKERAEYESRFERSLGGTVQAIGRAVELRDPYTAGHQRNVARLASALADELGLEPEFTFWIGVAASIHDIGKIATPTEILSKPTRLTEIEFSLVRQHPVSGYEILADVDFPYPVAEMVRQHHERVDGSGYPDQLVGDQIGIGARIIAVADTVEAVTSHRPYRPGRGLDAALDIITADRGTRLDERVVDACNRLFRESRFEF